MGTAAKKMTFSIPEPLATELLKKVSSRDRSRYVTDALMAKMRLRDEALARACDLANQEEDISLMEREFDAISGDIAEPWTDAKAR